MSGSGSTEVEFGGEAHFECTVDPAKGNSRRSTSPAAASRPHGSASPLRCAAGDLAKVVQGRVHREPGHLQQPIWAGGERGVPGEGGVHQGGPELHLHPPAERLLGGWELLHLSVQHVPRRLQEEAHLSDSYRWVSNAGGLKISHSWWKSVDQ